MLICNVCKKNLSAVGRKKCHECLTKTRNAVKRLHKERSAQGLCPRCGKGPCLPGLKNCQACTDYARTHQRKPSSKVRRKVQYEELRQRVLDHYGGKCVCCGESGPQFLTLDHINGDGGARRKELPSHLRTGGGMYGKIVRDGFPYPDYLQVLCYNCNCARGHHGYCHETPK
jgi:hypothetical protein